MTNAEKEMVKYLMYDSGADTCSKCIHNGNSGCPQYISETDFSGDIDDDVCIAGMTAFFEQGDKPKEKCQHCGKIVHSNSKHTIKINNNDVPSRAYDKITLCPECWCDLVSRRDKVDKDFMIECVHYDLS